MESSGIKSSQIAEGKAMQEWNDWYNSEAGRERRERKTKHKNEPN